VGLFVGFAMVINGFPFSSPVVCQNMESSSLLPCSAYLKTASIHSSSFPPFSPSSWAINLSEKCPQKLPNDESKRVEAEAEEADKIYEDLGGLDWKLL
jgi:hypothetical protein